MKTDLEKYFHKRIKSIIGEMKTPASKRTSETFHRLRVEMKKIKSLFALVDFTDKKFKQRKSFEPFKALFKGAGEFRALQLEEKFFKKHSAAFNTAPFIQSIREKQETALVRFEKQTGESALKEMESTKRKLKPHLSRIKKKHIQAYIKKAIKKIHRLGSSQFKKDEMHETRKQLKEWLYNMRHFMPEQDKVLMGMDELQDLIGKWHDNDVTSNHLRRARQSEHVTQAQLSGINRVLAAISSQNEKLFRKINRKIRL